VPRDISKARRSQGRQDRTGDRRFYNLILWAALSLGYDPSMKKPAGAPPKLYTWSIYHIKGTPAALLGRVEAPDEESAIKKAIEEFNVSPAFQKRLLAQRR
jgi:hypothetical protein